MKFAANHLHDVRFVPGKFEIEDIEFKIIEGVLYFDIKRLGGTIHGSAWKNNIFGEKESFDFLIESDNNGIGMLWTIDYKTDPWNFPEPIVSWA